jgi:hypothetical protein
VKDDKVDRVFVLSFVSEFAFLFALRFATRELELFELLLLVFVILAIAKISMTTPITINTKTAPMPRIHGKALRFCGVGGGIGDHAGGGGGGGVDDGGGRNAIVAWGDVSRGCGYMTVVLGSEGGGALVPSNGEPSSRQKLKASSA